MSSSEAALIPGASWALGEGDDLENLDERIRVQQLDIQRELTNLSRLQRELGMKTLPSLQQKVLQADLSKLQAIQSRLKAAPGNREFQMQLVGQQMLLSEHLLEIQESLSHGLPDVESQLEHVTQRMPHSISSGSINQDTRKISSSTMPQLQPQYQPPTHYQPQPQYPSQMQPSYPAQPMYDPLTSSAGVQMLMQQQLLAGQMRQQITNDLLAEQQRQQLLMAERRRQQMMANAALGNFGANMYSPLTPSLPFI